MSKLNKIIAVGTAIATTAWMTGAAFVPVVSAATAAEIQAQIDALMETLAGLQAQLTDLEGGTTGTSYEGIPDGFQFTEFMKRGSKSDEVKYLQIVLQTEVGESVVGTADGIFGGMTDTAVKQFQGDNSLVADGLVGAKSRAVLNEKLASQSTDTDDDTTDDDTTGDDTTDDDTTGDDTTGDDTTDDDTTVAEGLTVSLASDTPLSGTFVQGQALAELAKFTLVNGGDSEIKVTTLKFKRLGVSADTTPSKVYLFNGATRLTDEATVSSGIVNFVNTTGIVTIASKSTKTISVKANITDSTSGQTIGIGINSADDIEISGSETVAGSFPINGNLHSIASATLASVDFNTTTTPSAATISPQDEYVMWQNTTTIGTRYVWFKEMRLRQIGSIQNADLANFKLYVDGIQVGVEIAALDSSGYVTFDFNDTPQKLETGSRTIKLVGDIINGSSRNFSFSLRQAADAVFEDNQYGTTVLPTANSATFSARSTGTQTIDTGVLTITKKSDSPSGNIVPDAAGIVYGAFELKASGENMKVENLRITFTGVDVDPAGSATLIGKLRNGALFANGVQIGSTADINEDSQSTAYTEYSLGSQLVVEPGSPVTLEIKADVYDSDGTNSITSTDTIQAKIAAGSSNVQRMSSLGYGSYPASAVSANTLTVSTGALNMGKYTAYANQTSVAPKIAYKLAHFKLSANESEDVNVTSITIDLDGVAGLAPDASDDLSDLYVVYDGNTTAVKTSVTDTSNVWNINYTLPANASIDVEVYASVASTITDGTGDADTIRADVTIAGTTSASATSATTGEVQGQTITWSTGSISVAKDGSSPINQISAGGQEVKAASFVVTATNDDYTIKEINVKVGSATISSAITEAVLKVGTEELGRASFDYTSSTISKFLGLSEDIPANSSKVFDVYLNLNDIGTGAGSSQQNVTVTWDYYKYANSQGTEATSGTDVTTNAVYVYKSIPTFSQVEFTSGGTVGTTVDLYKFKVSADSQGPLSLKQIKLAVSWSDLGTDDTLSVRNMKLYRGDASGGNLTDITTLVVMQDEDGTSVEGSTGLTEASSTTLVINWNDGTNELEEAIGAGESYTYVIKGQPNGFHATGADTQKDSVSMYIAADSSHNGTSIYLNAGTTLTSVVKLYTSAATGNGSAINANIIWSDKSLVSHAYLVGTSSSGDWANGYLVNNLDLGAQTWTY